MLDQESFLGAWSCRNETRNLKPEGKYILYSAAVGSLALVIWAA